MGDGGIEDFEAGVFFEEFITDGLDEVSFTETWSTIEKEWVITTAGCINNTAGSGNSEVIIGADDEIIKSIFIV